MNSSTVKKHSFDNQNITSIDKALEIANMQWDVEPIDMITVNGINIPFHRAMVRDDNNAILGVVGNRYEAIQNSSAFALMDVLCQEHGAVYNYIYEINGGSKIILQAKIPGSLEIQTGDKCDLYINMINSFDGSTGLITYFTTIRLWCQNQLNASFQNASNKVTIRHTKSAESCIQEAFKIWGISEKYFAIFQKKARELAQKKIDRNMVNIFLKEVFGEAESSRMKNTHNEVIKLFNHGMGNHGRTAWDLYNGVTEYIDHHRGSNDEKRMVSSLVGNGVNIKEKAFNIAMAI